MELQEYLEKFQVSLDDLLNIKELGQLISDHIPWLFDTLFDWLANRQDFGYHFQNKEFIKGHRHLLEQLWGRFFSGKVDWSFIEERKRIGIAHHRVDLSLEVYFEGVSALTMLFNMVFDKAEVKNNTLIRSFFKLYNLEVFVVVDTYNKVTKAALKEQNDALKIMATPIARLRRGVLFLPLVGILDSQRAKSMMDAMLSRITEDQARVFILDINGITTVDSAVANYLIKLVKATRLMGCHTILSGISGIVAQTIVELGIDTASLDTTGSLEDAIVKANQRL